MADRRKIIEVLKDINSIPKLKHYMNAYKVEKMHRKYNGKKSVLNYPPRFVTIGITGFCGFSCRFCISHGAGAEDNHQYKVPFNINFEEFKTIVDKVYKAKVPHIHISGLGEPILHKDFFKMFDYVTDKYFYSSLQTDFIQKVFEKKKIIEKILERKDKIKYITTDLFPESVHNDIKLGSDYKYVVDSMEHISKNSKIRFNIHQILTTESYKDMDVCIKDLHSRGINFSYDVVNLHTTDFNDFTSPDKAYYSKDKEINEELKKIKKLGTELGVPVNVPEPWDIVAQKSSGICENLWSRIQVMPSKKLPKERWSGNAITSQCTAEVTGEFYTIGNVLDHEDFMDFWNNPIIVKYRDNMINGIYPDEKCKNCFIYKKEIDAS